MKVRFACAIAALFLLGLAACSGEDGPAPPPGTDVVDGAGGVDAEPQDAQPDATGEPDAPDAGGDTADAGTDAPDPADVPDTTVADVDATGPAERLLVTEVMRNPKAVPDGDGEWIELTNVGEVPVALDGLRLRDDGTDDHVITGSGVVLKPGELVVVGSNGDQGQNGGAPVGYVYSGFVLGNDADAVIVERDGVVLDRVAYGAGWPDVEGSSFMLAPSAMDEAANDAPGAWCASVTPMSGGDRGTPGEPNPPCVDPVEADCTNGTDDDGDGVTDCDDSDCYAAPACAPIPPGALVITEIMQNPDAVQDTVGEWIEIANTTDMPLDLDGLVLAKASGTKHVISNGGPLLVAPGGLIVLGASADTAANGGAPVAYTWSGYSLGNGADDVILRSGDLVVDQVAWDDGATFPDPTGASMALSPDALDADANDAGAAWCASTAPFGAGDLGTPGLPNPPCEPPLCGNGEPDPGEVCDDGNQVPGDGCEPNCKVTPGGCGDGKMNPGEECDDGNLKAGDGCSPSCELEQALPPGALLITEIMVNPKAVDDPKGEWFEVLNTTVLPVDLAGFTIGDGQTDLHVITPKKPLLLAPGKRFVLGPNDDVNTNGGLIVDYAYGADLVLGNGGDTLFIAYGKVVDSVTWTFPAFPGFEGRAMQLAPEHHSAVANDLASSWCGATAVYGAGDFGTPGAPNTPCVPCGNGTKEPEEQCDDGNFVSGDGCEPDCTLTPPPCGNGKPDAGEQCDDGNDVPGDGCEPDCTLTPPLCGNGALDDGEECDDGNADGLDGCDADCKVEVAPGDVVITEIMQNPAAVADADGEWFEVRNLRDHDIPLGGWTIADMGTDLHVIGDLVLPAGGVLVLGNNAEMGTNGGAPVDYQYAGVVLGNGADSIVLSRAGVVIDQVAWDDGLTFPDPDGASMQLDATKLDAGINDLGGAWCVGQVPYGAGDRGTPGGANLPCTGLVKCGDGACDPDAGEDCRTCTGDCGPCDGCLPAAAAGCGGCACEACVCGDDAFCCDVAWDLACALGCSACGAACQSDGCSPSVLPGCGQCACEAAVCAADPSCCDVAWDDGCVAACVAAGGDCGSDGCSVSALPGCDGCGCEACVCAQDPSCCDVAWDIQCVQRCFECSGGCLSDGCAASALPGCNGCACEAAVCGDDAWCCEVAWDVSCAAACGATQDCGSDGCAVSQLAGCGSCACEADVCAGDPICCEVAWDASCAAACAATQDCGSDGCSPSVRPGCGGCACEAAVCAADPACCDVAWDLRCALACSATQDCGTDGCSPSVAGGCGGCACEAAVCAADPACCDVAWDAACVVACLAHQDCGFSCGDGTLEPGEQCDQGASNSDTEPGACRTSCEPAWCGDGVTDPGESCDDGNDAPGDGCASCLVETPAVGPGDLVITEIMQNPAAVSDALGEWFEVKNTTSATLDLSGLVIRDNGTDSHVIEGGPQVLLGPGAVLALGNNGNPATNGGAPVGYQYSGVTLGNTSDAIIVMAGAVVIDQVAWDDGATFPKPNGASMSLDPSATDAAANDLGAAWCLGTTGYGAGDMGTPGAPNPVCPACGDGVCGDLEICATCPGDCGACSDGCTESPWPGCSGCACEACVCAADSFCCDTAWDAACVTLCALDCQGCSTCGNGQVEPGEECDDGGEEDGDGCSAECAVEVTSPYPGSLVITEIMADPVAVSDLTGEWVEVLNVTSTPLTLDGLQLADASGATFTVAPAVPLVVAPGARVVFGLSGTEGDNGGVAVDVVYGGFALGDAGDTVTLLHGGKVVDQVAYGPPFPLVPGRSMSLDPGLTTAADNDDAESWCAGNQPFGDGDLGTPGAPNPPCGSGFCGNGLVESGEECDHGGANSDTEPDACRTDCRAPSCGDGVTDTGESCDDGNDEPGDGCEVDCKATGEQDCGNGTVELPEECDDGNDDPTDGCTECEWSALPVQAGALVITEILAVSKATPSPAGAWIEIYNPGVSPVDVRLLVVSDGAGGLHTIAGGPDPRLVPPGEFAVLGAAGPAVNGGVAVLDTWGGAIALGPAGGNLVRLISPAGVVDEVYYGEAAFPPLVAGVSIELDQGYLDELSNDEGGRWCPSQKVFGAGDQGSPGAGGHDCSAIPACGNGIVELGESCDDGNDVGGDGCSEGCVTEEWPQPGPGELVITEIMQNPAAVDDAGGEWFEVRNVTGDTLDLSGVVMKDLGSDVHVISPEHPLLVAAGAHLVLGRSSDVGGGLAPGYVYAGFTLGNASDAIVLEGAAGLIDAVAYDNGLTFPDPDGASMSLDPEATTAAANDLGANWCAGKTPYGAGDLGSPGAANPPCSSCGDGVEDPGEDCDDGNDEGGDGCEPDCTLTPDCGNGVVEAGEQCDDGNEASGDGCSGCLVDSFPAPGLGDVVITEIMVDPVALPDALGEWIEVYNNTAGILDLSGVVLRDNGGEAVVLSPAKALWIKPGQHLVLARTDAAGVDPAAVYGDAFTLDDDADEVILEGPAGFIDQVQYSVEGGFPLAQGASMSLGSETTTAFLNDLALAWCVATTPFASGDLGTPGAPNPACPYCGNGVSEGGEACDDGNQDTGDGCEPDCTLTPDCGNGVVEAGEACDDGNEVSGDGCSADCAVEIIGHPPAGAVVITEIMQNPEAVPDAAGEWVELTSVGTVAYDLSGVVLRDDDGEAVTLSPTAPLLLPPGGVLLLGRSGDLGGGLAPDWVYGGGFSLLNGADGVILEGELGIIDVVRYDDGVTFPDPIGRSMSLSPDMTDAVANDDGAAWCEGFVAYGAGDFGTPGAPNPPCPVCGDGAVEGWEECDDGNDEGGDGCEVDCTVTPAACGNGLLDAGEECDDGNEDDGDGCDSACFFEFKPPAPGQLVITEIMRDPVGAGTWWVEVTNVAGVALDLDGLALADDGTDLYLVASAAPVPLLPGEAFVFAADGDLETNGGVPVDHVVAGFSLDADQDQVILLGELGVLDRVAYDDGFPSLPGASMALDPGLYDAVDNDLPEAWCLGALPYGAGGLGTPGAVNPPCPICGDGVVVAPEECDDGPGNSDSLPDACRTDCREARCGDGVVDNGEECDGSLGAGCTPECLLLSSPIVPGDLVITEIMVDSVAVDDAVGEWFEVFNRTGEILSIGGLHVADGQGSALVLSVLIPPYGTVVLGRSADPALNGGVPVDYVYEGVTLGDSEGTLALSVGGVLIDQVEWWAGWPLASGAALSLDVASYDAVANDDPASWCLATQVYGTGDRGTPGLANDQCGGCGNGVKEPGEGCDAGPLNSDTVKDACRLTCELPWCGDGVVDTGEECDEGVGNSDVLAGVCRTSCELPGCGDGVTDPAEFCDDGNLSPGDGCEPDCTVGPVLCGNGALDAHEQCDDGNLDPGDGCEPDCSYTNYCGNGDLDPGEQCDDGENEPGDGCDPSCLLDEGPPVPGELVITEIMKSPLAVSDPQGEWFEVRSVASRTLVLDGWGLMDDTSDLHVIGSLQVPPGGVVVFGTNGDVGTNGGVVVDYVYPSVDLVLDVADSLVIGDGLVEIDRVDWDGGWPSTPGVAMNLDPGRTTAVLNDKQVSWCDASGQIAQVGPDFGSPGETNPICWSLLCGNAKLDGTEQCDDGASNSDTEPDACRSDCTVARCGDFVTDGGEECDDGGLIGGGCEPDCTWTRVCGNGVVEPGEECDDFNDQGGDGCTEECQIEVVCGDGVVAGDEECDDGTGNSDEVPGACRLNCVFAFCGDGVLDPGEGCDDGNQDAGDGCEPGCPIPVACGNGVVEPGEECDHGMQNSDTLANACRTSCKAAHCGDGTIDAGEVCDDGNDVDGDACPSSCAAIPPSPGAVIVNELMIHPSAVVDSDGEWIELANTTSDWIDLRGMVVSDIQGQSHTIADLLPVLLPAHGYIVLTNNGNPGANGGVFPGYVYPSADLGLEDVEDGVILTFDEVEIDRVVYTVGWPAGSGASMSLAPWAMSAVANDVPAAWCNATSEIGAMPGADLGTPGGPNDPCP
ncbi:MAG: hypothetical protein AMXMBFR64_17190 [Myxococcales bacterium]